MSDPKNYDSFEKDQADTGSQNQQVYRSRRAKKEEQRKAQENVEATPSSESSPKKSKKKRKYKLNIKQFIKFLICICLLVGIAVVGYLAYIIKTSPEIETDNIYSMLSQSTVLYDDQGEIIDNVFGDKNRTIVTIDKIPDHVQKAFIALEDKTFETHNGFNIIRIFGAIRDAVFNGGHISGTSTITQQLARNLYMEDEMSTRSIERKVREAYYALILEKNLLKPEILEAYLNTINFGFGYGIQTASQAYFSKDVDELTVAEAAALAAMPQAPSAYALVLQVAANDVTDEEKIILKNGDYAYIYNDKAYGRMQTCIKLMHEQGYIDDAQYEEAMAVTIKDIVNPTIDALNIVSNYFADYVVSTVIKDLQAEYGYDYAKAYQLVYNGGVRIHTTMNSQAQSVLEKEFKVDENFPVPMGYTKDKNGNIKNPNGGILLYAHSYYIEEDSSFKLKKSEYEWNSDGSLTIFAGKRLNIYNTTVNGQTDYSVEFKNMYDIVDKKFYSIPGGFINIPQEYKSRDKDNNLVVSAKFFDDYPNFFVKEDNGKLSTKEYSLKQRIIQPQAAMTIIDNKTGAIKAMIGGRKISGRLLFNRATAPRQPGSSIKPIAVYAAALQRSHELAQMGETFPLTETGFDEQGTALWGNYITTASIVDDEPTTINNKIWPKNSYRSYKGLYTFRTALQQSVNVCAVKILSQVGVDYAFDIAEKFGLTTLVKSGDVNDLNLAALGMGGLSKGVSTLEMASAYTTFVNDGIHKSYSCYTKVTTRNGDVLLEPNVIESEVLDPGVAWIMRDVLQTVVSEGIGSYAKVSGAKVGGKTGTTSDSYDIWFDGFTANYSASIWIGNDVNIKLSSMSPMAARLWGKVMSQIPDAKGGTYSKRPKNVVTATVDTKSGMLATEESSNTRSEYFTEGTQPLEAGSLNQTVAICDESGYLATSVCPHTSYESGIMRPYIPNKKVKDYGKELPHYYCNLHNPNPDVYPAKPGLKVTIMDEPPIVDEPIVEEPVIDPENPIDTPPIEEQPSLPPDNEDYNSPENYE